MIVRFITIIILFTVWSCRREHMDLEGKVIDSLTGDAIPEMKIIVLDMVKSGNKFVQVYNSEFSTDSSGHFSYSLPREKSVYLFNFCVVGNSDYAFSNTKMSLGDLNRDGKFLYLKSNRLADLLIRTDMKNEYGTDKELFITWKSDKVNGATLFPYRVKNFGFTSSNTGLKWTGGDIKSEINTKVYAEKETVVRWEIFNAGERMVITDTIFCRRDVRNYVNFTY